MNEMELSGRVLRGQRFGRVLGYPTANLDRRSFVRSRVKPRLGVYAGTVRLGQRTYLAGIVIGPVDRRGLPKIEAHLLGFKGNIYGRTITLRLGEYLRPFKKYVNPHLLKKQIKQDLIRIKKKTPK